jgi:hypothetical protein
LPTTILQRLVITSTLADTRRSRRTPALSERLSRTRCTGTAEVNEHAAVGLRPGIPVGRVFQVQTGCCPLARGLAIHLSCEKNPTA